MKLRKILSGGQTGADRTGLECAKELGLETGGTAPKYYLTESGYDESLKEFGLKESWSIRYQPRTRDNVVDSDGTVWFGTTTSPGYICTRNFAIQYGKPFGVNPTPEMFKHLANIWEVINIAGNRKSKNPGVVDLVREAFKVLKR